MAELLIKATARAPIRQSGPLKGQVDPYLEKVLYRRGDVVVVMEDGHEWGGEERPPNFVVIKVPGPKSEWDYLAEERMDGLPDEDGDEKIALRRHHGFDLDALPGSDIARHNRALGLAVANSHIRVK